MSEIFSNSPTLLRRRGIESITGLSRSTIYELIKKGQFPKPIKLTERAVAWSRADVLAWVEMKLASAGPR